jgi:hypothetical protein
MLLFSLRYRLYIRLQSLLLGISEERGDTVKGAKEAELCVP